MLRKINLLGFSAGLDPNNKLVKGIIPEDKSGEIANTDESAKDKVIKAKGVEGGGEERWITVNGRHIKISSSTGDVVQGGKGMVDGGDIKNVGEEQQYEGTFKPQMGDTVDINLSDGVKKDAKVLEVKGDYATVSYTTEEGIEREDTYSFSQLQPSKDIAQKAKTDKFSPEEVTEKRRELDEIKKSMQAKESGDSDISDNEYNDLKRQSEVIEAQLEQEDKMQKGMEQLTDEEIEILQVIAQALLENEGDDWDGESDMFDKATANTIESLKNKGCISMKDKGISGLTKKGMAMFKSLKPDEKEEVKDIAEEKIEEKTEELNETAETIDSQVEENQEQIKDNQEQIEENTEANEEHEEHHEENLDDQIAENASQAQENSDSLEEVQQEENSKEQENQTEEVQEEEQQAEEVQDEEQEEAQEDLNNDLNQEEQDDEDESDLGGDKGKGDFVEEIEEEEEEKIAEEEQQEEEDYSPEELASHAANTPTEDLKKFIVQSENKMQIEVAKKELAKRGELDEEDDVEDEKAMNDWFSTYLEDHDKEDLIEKAIELLKDDPKEMKVMKGQYRDAYSKEHNGNKVEKVDPKEMGDWLFKYLGGLPDPHLIKYVKGLMGSNPDSKKKMMETYKKYNQ